MKRRGRDGDFRVGNLGGGGVGDRREFGRPTGADGGTENDSGCWRIQAQIRERDKGVSRFGDLSHA